MNPRPFSLVTVVFEPEHALLELQARSLATYLSPRDVAELVVIDNGRSPLPSETRARLMAAYGPLAPKVQLVRPADIGLQGLGSGWRRQQVAKLVIARSITADWYLTLDAKNHALRPVDPELWVTPDGRLRMRVHGFEAHRLRPDLERVLRYEGLSTAEHVERFPSTVTPFPLDTSVVREILADVEGRSGRTFEREFVRRGLTEYFLYSTWSVAHRGPVDEIFSADAPPSATIWPKAARDAAVRRTIERTASDAVFFAVHRRAVTLLPADGVDALLTLWERHRLVSSRDDAQELFERVRAETTHVARLSQRRDRPRRVVERLLRRPLVR